ncbi:complement decay-accelerating factor, GPI-anchored isoform X1 [Acanthopagrus latus]|uniref:complement decay-accelerating factor, GPI-anchored isoform X1 n=1 Tax=Acanthopagrus latus TaxID=8177 RepID=UPI00187BC616|nr:complement decay-accelerating factor, GPI-anchored isoform X1 [Acanthopagrus latus]
MEVLLDTCGRLRVRPLLLMYIFVLKAAADCPQPQGGENIVLSNEALLMNKFPEGSDVTLECANGYVKESGSGVTTCADTKWTEPDLICKKKDCGPPKMQPHMIFNASHGTLFGATIRITCDTGYQVSGNSYKQCLVTGWTGRAKCELVTCDIPAEVAHGKRSWESEDYPTYEQVIRYTCDDGYTLVGKDTLVCSDSGEYDSEPPECKSVTTEKITTTVVTSTPTPPAQEASTSTDPPATSTAHRVKANTASATSAVSPTLRGGRHSLPAEDKATTASETSTTSFQDIRNHAVEPSRDSEYVPVIISVVAVLVVACIAVLCVHKFLLRRKGSYDTREDLKPELLQFQNL